MGLSLAFLRNLNVLNLTIYFFQKHFKVVFGLGLIAALGRVIQLGGFGAISPSTNIVLEMLVEAARILLVLYVLGLANLKNGLLRIRRLFKNKGIRKQQWKIALHLRKEGGLPLF